MSILHFLGGTSIDLRVTGRIAQTKMTISQRALVHDVLCDVVCTGRFYDFLEKRSGRWGLVLRQPIYEKDRIDPVDPRPRCISTGSCSRRFPKAIGTSPTCSPASVTTSSPTCRASSVPKSKRSTRAAATGWPAQPL